MTKNAAQRGIRTFYVAVILRRSTYQKVRLTAQDIGSLASKRF
jgi:hypothetical protein